MQLEERAACQGFGSFPGAVSTGNAAVTHKARRGTKTISGIGVKQSVPLGQTASRAKRFGGPNTLRCASRPTLECRAIFDWRCYREFPRESRCTGTSDMIAACHIIFGAYGIWLPNDPRGSWSDCVGSWELFRHGTATKTDGRRSAAYDAHDRAHRVAVKAKLKCPAGGCPSALRAGNGRCISIRLASRPTGLYRDLRQDWEDARRCPFWVHRVDGIAVDKSIDRTFATAMGYPDQWPPRDDPAVYAMRVPHISSDCRFDRMKIRARNLRRD